MEESKYDIALSFAGEDRDYVEKVAFHLKSFGVRVFYDKYEQVNLWGKDLYSHLSDIYHKRAQYTVIFISAHYKDKLWTNHERESAQARAFREKQEYILPARFDDTEVPGILPTTGYVDLRSYAPRDFALLLRKKLNLKAQSKLSGDASNLDVEIKTLVDDLWEKLDSENLQGEDAWVEGYNILDRFRFRVDDDEMVFKLYTEILSVVEVFMGSIWRDTDFVLNLFTQTDYRKKALQEYLYYNYSNCTNDYSTVSGVLKSAEVAIERGMIPIYTNCIRKAALTLASAYGLGEKRPAMFSRTYEGHALEWFLKLIDEHGGIHDIPDYEIIIPKFRARSREIKDEIEARLNKRKQDESRNQT